MSESPGSFSPVSHFERVLSETPMRFAASRGAKCIAITDSSASPLCEHCDLSLCAKSNMTSFVDSLVAPFSLVNAMIVAIGLKKKEQISASFAELEKIWIEHNVYAGGK